MDILFKFVFGILTGGADNSKGRLLYSVLRILKILCASFLILLVLLKVRPELNISFLSDNVLPDNISQIFGDNLFVILSVIVVLVLANKLSGRAYGVVSKKTSDAEKRTMWYACILTLIDIVYILLTVWYVGYTFNMLLLFSQSGKMTITIIQSGVGYVSFMLLFVYIIRRIYHSNFRFAQELDVKRTNYSDVTGKRIASNSKVFYTGIEYSVENKNNKWQLYPKGYGSFSDDMIVDLEQAASNPDGNLRVEI